MAADERDPELVAQDGVGVADQLQRLWTPHRLAYIKGENKPEGDEPQGCPFCRLVDLDDETALILARAGRCTRCSTSTRTTRGT